MIFKSSKILFFDTETTDLPLNFNAPVSDLDNWPRIVQLAWQLRRGDGTPLSSCSSIIKPVGFTIPERVVKIHGITTEKAIREGEDLKIVMNSFWDAILDADYIVAHNLDFDLPICGAEFIRSLDDDMISHQIGFCTQKQTTAWAKIPKSNGHGYKWPSLAELHARCGFGAIANAHDAMADVHACQKCFFHILNAAPDVFSNPYQL